MTTLDEAVAERMIQHLRDSTTDLGSGDIRIPISHFVSPERAAAERAVLRRTPLVVGHSSELPENGNFITRAVLGTPLIIARGPDGTVRSFVNMCRHRGGRVESAASGTKKYFACSYHGWTYSAATGELAKVPYERFFENVDHSCHGLGEARTEERHGLLWVTLNGDGDRTVADHLGPEMGAVLDGFELDQSTIFLDKTIPLSMNWKLVMDGAIDVLHPRFLHPQGVGKLIETQTSVWQQHGRHGRSYSPRRKMTALVKSGESIAAGWKYISSNTVIYPNASLIAAPDHVEFWTVWPDVNSATACTVQIRFLIRADRLDDAMAARLTRSWEILEDAAMNEDWPMAQSIQDNAIACPDGEFLYGRNEQQCAHLHRQLAEDIGA